MSCRNQGKKTKDLLSKSSHNKKSVLYRDADISMLPTQVLLQKKKGKKTVISAREREIKNIYRSIQFLLFQAITFHSQMPWSKRNSYAEDAL